MNRLHYSNSDSSGQQPPHPACLEIDLSRRRRWWGWASYLLLVAGTCAAIVWFFLYFSVPLTLAIVIVVFMVGYMVLMGWWGSRNLEGKK